MYAACTRMLALFSRVLNDVVPVKAAAGPCGGLTAADAGTEEESAEKDEDTGNKSCAWRFTLSRMRSERERVLALAGRVLKVGTRGRGDRLSFPVDALPATAPAPSAEFGGGMSGRADSRLPLSSSDQFHRGIFLDADSLDNSRTRRSDEGGSD